MDAIKCLFLKAQYRSPIDFSDERLVEARQALEHLYVVIDRWPNAAPSKDAEVTKQRILFEEAMDDDCNTPQALSVLFDTAALARASSPATAAACAAMIRELGRRIFGLFAEHGATSDAAIEAKIAARNAARKQGDFAASDRIRKELQEAGIILEDTKDGTLWRRKR